MVTMVNHVIISSGPSTGYLEGLQSVEEELYPLSCSYCLSTICKQNIICITRKRFFRLPSDESSNANAWPLCETTCLVLWLKFPIGLLLWWANSIGPGWCAGLPEPLLFVCCSRMLYACAIMFFFPWCNSSAYCHGTLALATLWADSADYKLVIFFLLFLENRIWHFMQIVS